MRFALLIWSLTAGLLIQSCGPLHRTVAPGAVYKEPAAVALVDGEAAILTIDVHDKNPFFRRSLDNLHIESVDGVKMDGDIGGGTFSKKNNVIQVELAPGLHCIASVYRRDSGCEDAVTATITFFLLESCPRKWDVYRSRICFAAEAKRHYQLEAEYENDRVWSWIEDEVTGEVIAGTRYGNAFDPQ
jgi:hypothetical protein